MVKSKHPRTLDMSSFSWKKIISHYAIYIIFVGMCLLLSILRPNDFLTSQNLLNVGQQSAVNLIIAIGATFIIITGGIDLSVGAVVALAGVGMIAVLTATPVVAALGAWTLPFAILCGLLVGLISGVLSGLIISRLRVPPFIVTLAAMVMGRGLVKLYTNGVPIGIPDPGTPFESAKNALLTKLSMIVGGMPGGTNQTLDYLSIAAPFIIAAVMAVFGHILLTKTRFGRWVYAIGGNEEATRLSGININKVKVGVYALAGTLAALGGIIVAASLKSGIPTSGDGYELNAIAAAVVGGTSLAGGRGTITGTVIGALIFGVLNNGLNLMGYSPFLQEIVRGAVILLAVILDRITKND